jgi:hypothetical protein
MLYDNYNALVIGGTATRTLVSEAIGFGDTPFAGKRQLVIRAISKKQRPRRGVGRGSVDLAKSN